MATSINVSTPSRLCLFGEHQDYLGLEVIATAINLRFRAEIKLRRDNLLTVYIRDAKLDRLDSQNPDHLYEYLEIDLTRPIVYKGKRDYLRSTPAVLQRLGYPLTGCEVHLDSEIPIGKGMCSSSTMIIALIKALLEIIDHPDKDDPCRIAELAYLAEVAEFSEPGGRMDHYTSALGGLVHLDFRDAMQVSKLDVNISGDFILFDSLQQKDTTKVLAASKIPAQSALEKLRTYGINSIRDFLEHPDNLDHLMRLDDFHRRKIVANIENYRLLRRGLTLLADSEFMPETLGKLLTAHHEQLRDGLGISTPKVESILECALNNGAWGGKINGSGGGGCCFVYAPSGKSQTIIDAVSSLGYPGKVLQQDSGVRRDN